MKGFLRELRARNVDRAALAYAGAGWLLAQGAQLLADAYQWPGWVIRALLAALMLGFPLVLVLAWFFEWMPAGLVADGADGPASAIRLRTRRKLDLAIAMLVVAALVYIATTWDWRASDPRPARAVPPPAATLAVLPFKPLLAATRDEALELGMTDTLIARLSSIEKVTVRPLSSVRRYGDLEQDALAAGRELEVASVLDGSIQQLDDRLRVTVRLLNVSDGRQLWSAQFDERRDDVFAVQDSIAERVIAALAVRPVRGRRGRARGRTSARAALGAGDRELCIPAFARRQPLRSGEGGAPRDRDRSGFRVRAEHPRSCARRPGPLRRGDRDLRRRPTPGPRGYADVAFALVSAGRADEARKELVRLSALARERYVPAYDIAIVHALLGDVGAAFEWLEKAVEERSTMALIPADPALKSLREDQRFQDFLIRLHVRSAT